MPIKVKIVDNDSLVKVKPICNTDEVDVKTGCNTDKARLENLINQEKQQRIAADEELERQIQEGLITFIAIDSYITSRTPIQYNGTITNEVVLNSLRDSKVNKVTFGNKVYTFSVRNGNFKQYFCVTNSSPNFPVEPSFNMLELNTQTGEFRIYDSGFDAHIKNNTIHISEHDRNFWDNKVTAFLLDDPSPHEGDTDDNKMLVLARNSLVDENGNVIE